MSEPLIFAVTILALGYVFVAVICWIFWRQDRDIHARIAQAASLRGEKAPLPPRTPKTPEEPTPEPAPEHVEVCTPEPEKPEEEPFPLDAEGTFLGYPCKLNPNLPKAPKYSFAWAKDRMVTADELAEIFDMSDDSIRKFIHYNKLGITGEFPTGGATRTRTFSFNSFVRQWLKFQATDKRGKHYNFFIVNERLKRSSNIVISKCIFTSNNYNLYIPESFICPSGSKNTGSKNNFARLVYPSEFYSFLKKHGYLKAAQTQLEKQYSYIKD